MHPKSNSCRGTIRGRIPLINQYPKRALKFYKHLKCIELSSYQAEALQFQERALTAAAETTSKPAQHNLAQPNYTIIQLQKQNCIFYWKDATKFKKKMELYLHLKRDYKPAEYLSCVKELKVRKKHFRPIIANFLVCN